MKRLLLELNPQQGRVLDEMLASGLRGQTLEDVAGRILDAAFIEFKITTKFPPEPREREPWEDTEQ